MEIHGTSDDLGVLRHDCQIYLFLKESIGVKFCQDGVEECEQLVDLEIPATDGTEIVEVGAVDELVKYRLRF